MSYDSWKLGSQNADRDQLADWCSDAKRAASAKLNQAIGQANQLSPLQWENRDVSAETDDDDEIWLELTLRLSRIPGNARGADLRMLATALTNLGNQLANLARGEQTPAQGMKMAPSATERSLGRKSDAG